MKQIPIGRKLGVMDKRDLDAVKLELRRLLALWEVMIHFKGWGRG